MEQPASTHAPAASTQPRSILIAPSLLAADFAKLPEEIARVEKGGADWLHVDVMDGHFVPNLTLGPFVVEAIRRLAQVPLDCHLMIENPNVYAPEYAKAGARCVTFHVEALVPTADRTARDRGWALVGPQAGHADIAVRAREVIDMLHRAGCLAGVALNPDTPASALEGFGGHADLVLAMTVWPGFGGQSFIERVVPKIPEIRRLAPNARIEVDGGLNPDTVRRAAGAGAEVIVAGSAVFRRPDPAAEIAAIRKAAESARPPADPGPETRD